MDDVTEKLSHFISQYKLPLILAGGGLICLVYGLISLLPQKPESDIVFTSAGQQSASQSAEKGATTNQLVIDVAGAVKKPGVYHIPEESRVADAIAAAGGLSEEADSELVAKQFNLAMKVSDGMKLYVPRLGEDTTPLRKGFEGQAVEGTGGNNNQININSASASELDSLAGVGKVTSEKIINGRPYTAIDELLSKKIVSQKVFDQIKDQISTY